MEWHEDARRVGQAAVHKDRHVRVGAGEDAVDRPAEERLP